MGEWVGCSPLKRARELYSRGRDPNRLGTPWVEAQGFGLRARKYHQHETMIMMIIIMIAVMSMAHDDGSAIQAYNTNNPTAITIVVVIRRTDYNKVLGVHLRLLL